MSISYLRQIEKLQADVAHLKQASEAALELVDIVTAERDALQAQVDVLKANLIRAVTAFRQYELDVEDYPSMQHKQMMQALKEATLSTPAACLADVRAEAIDDVWKKLHHRWKPDTDGDSAFVRVSEIKEMAERIRQENSK